MKYITIALAKGRLAKQTLALLEQTGITCEEMKDKDTRKLIFINEELKLKFFLSKTSDVPTYVEYGAADLGVVGSDMDGDPNGYSAMPAEGAVTESEGETDTADGATSSFETVIGGATA